MNITQLREKAKSLGIDPGKRKKTELIRLTQSAEGYQPCFGTSNGKCVYTNCCFADDCLKSNS